MSYKGKLKLLVSVFNQYIRLRDTDENGYGRCISCNTMKHYSDLDAGHFVNCKHLSLKFSEINVNAQCIPCNRFDEGNAAGYALGIMKKYDEGQLILLNIAKNKTIKFTEFELTEIIKHYRKLNKEMISNKTFKVDLK